MSDEMIREEERILEERVAEANWIQSAMLDQPIKSLPNLRPPTRLPPTASLREAITRMHEEGVGCVIVEQADRVVGVFTERDVLTKVSGRAVEIDTTAVGDLMTPDPECLTPDDWIAYALNLMTVGGFRHVPLVDDAGRAVGMIAMRHIVEYIVDLFPRGVLNLPPRPALSIARTREGA